MILLVIRQRMWLSIPLLILTTLPYWKKFMDFIRVSSLRRWEQSQRRSRRFCLLWDDIVLLINYYTSYLLIIFTVSNCLFSSHISACFNFVCYCRYIFKAFWQQKSNEKTIWKSAIKGHGSFFYNLPCLLFRLNQMLIFSFYKWHVWRSFIMLR